jgi:tetratricopeptide (TPR) repeat protein
MGLQKQGYASMRSLGPCLKVSLFAWTISTVIIIIGFLKGFNGQPLFDVGRNLAGALLAGVLFDWMSGASEDSPRPPVSRPSSAPLPRPSAAPAGRQSSSHQKFNPAVAHYNQGNAHARNGDFVRAIESFSRALRFNPVYVDALISRGIALHQRGDYENAIADLSEALAIDPRNAVAYYYRGSIHYRHGNYANAVADYDQSLRLDPSRETVRGSRRLAAERLGEAKR